MEPEELSRPVVVVPSRNIIKPWKADPRYPGLIYGFNEDKFSGEGEGAAPIMFKLASTLEEAGITCLMVGTSALIYFGAKRGRGDWQICVPTDKLETASLLLQSAPHTQDYTLSESPPGIDPESLFHTFPRFKCNGIHLWFKVVPSEDCHIECDPSNIERSKRGIPYPKLPVYAQSLLDTYDGVALCDLVDGMDLSTEWGEQNLDLSGMNDVAWAKAKNERIRASMENVENACLFELTEGEHSRKQFWEEVTTEKEHRLGIKYPKEYYATRFRLHSEGDPRDFDDHDF